MSESRLTGSRIREYRLAQGLRQADLAREVGISPAYLNLIEHNRRRIGGKLVVDLARLLGVEPAQLSEGAGDALVAGLRDAAARGLAETAEPLPERDRAEDFAGRFPGWAGLVTAQAARIAALEHLVGTLSDRLTHDPHLAAVLHEVVSSVTAIRASASILTETRDIDPDWQARFLRNVAEDSRRLSASAEGLVAWLDAGGEAASGGGGPLSPVDALADFVATSGYHWPELEPGARDTDAALAALATPVEAAATGAGAMARALLATYRADAAAMPAPAFAAARARLRDDPARIAASFGVPLDAVLRRMAATGGAGAGLVVCDGSGTLTLAKPVEGFVLPRFGAACPFWPLYQALARPAQPVSALLEIPGRTPRRFRARAIALPLAGTGFDTPPVLSATMLVEPADDDRGAAVAAGPACRICPRAACPARREPSILGTA